MTIQNKPMDINPEKVEEEMILDEGLDLWIIGPDFLASPTEELEAFPINPSDPTQMLQVGKKLDEGIKKELKQFLQKNTYVFTWKHNDMVGIEPSIACHPLKVNPKVHPKIHKRKPLSTERYGALKNNKKVEGACIIF
ncbi:reverse transcriptase [Abeliophyllum distichum]|uniref:Reverse transcriptase n=1 Tax=Abeliophyllum distichum TaxID=126358 RepID=A0ABD1QG92_9LAMI